MSDPCLNILNKTKDSLPYVIDFFSGCGGLGLGFSEADYKIAGGMDIDEPSVRTAAYNFYYRHGKEGHHLCGDIRETDPEIFRKLIGENGCIVIGGPPCQAYSKIGKGKLKSLGEARTHTNDSRGTLYRDFILHAVYLEARAVIMENVPESVNYGGQNIPQEVCELLEQQGYRAVWTILNSADYGVPQVRERVFVIAVAESENKDPVIPVPTHKNPEERLTSCQVRFARLRKCRNFRDAEIADYSSPNWVTVGEAFSDLPILFPNQNSKYHLLEPNVRLPYKSLPTNAFQRTMRGSNKTWLSMSAGHCFRRTVRDFPIFAGMKAGDDYRQASKVAEELLESACRIEMISRDSNPVRYTELRKKIVPPYSRDKFKDKWKKLDPNRPSHTLVAHLSVDTYSHIHPWEPRGISVREAARLQSFPDDYVFQCTMSEAFKQIGNAVPPLLSKAIAQAVRKIFNV